MNLYSFHNNKKHRPRCHRPISVPRKSRHAQSKNETISYRDFYVTSGSMEILKMTSRPLGFFNAQRRTHSTNRNSYFDNPYSCSQGHFSAHNVSSTKDTTKRNIAFLFNPLTHKCKKIYPTTVARLLSITC